MALEINSFSSYADYPDEQISPEKKSFAIIPADFESDVEAVQNRVSFAAVNYFLKISKPSLVLFFVHLHLVFAAWLHRLHPRLIIRHSSDSSSMSQFTVRITIVAYYPTKVPDLSYKINGGFDASELVGCFGCFSVCRRAF